MLATPGVEPELADALTELMIGEIAVRGGVSIVGKEEFQAQLGQTEARSLECIGSAACLGRVGVELRVDEVVAGTVGRTDTGWVYNLNRIDIASGELVGRAFERVQGEVDALAQSVESVLPRIFTSREPETSLHLLTSVEGAELYLDGVSVGRSGADIVRLTGLATGSHRLLVQAEGYHPYEREITLRENETMRLEIALQPRPAETTSVAESSGISSLVWIGMTGAVASGIVATVFGVRSQREVGSQGLTRQQAVREVESRERDVTRSYISLGAVGVSAAIGVIGLFLSDPEPEDVTRANVRLLVGSGAAGLAVEGTF